MVKGKGSFGASGLQFEPDDGVDPAIPMGWAPCLHDALVLNQFDIASHDQTAKERERAPGLGSITAGRPENAVNCFASSNDL